MFIILLGLVGCASPKYGLLATPEEAGCPGPQTPLPNDDGWRWYDYKWATSNEEVSKYDLSIILRDCLCGPAIPAAEGCQKRFDYNNDGFVDLLDIAIFMVEAKGWPK